MSSVLPRRGLAFTVRALVRIAVAGCLLLLVDVATTPLRVTKEVRRLARERPTRTRFMELSESQGRPVSAYSWVDLSAMSPLAVCAVVLTEDEVFFQQGTGNTQPARAT